MRSRPFASVVAEHGSLVLGVLTRLVGRHDAEDCWQETFLAALRAYPSLDEGANVRAWLVTIAHHKAIDHHRARARRPAAGAPDGDAPSDGPAPPVPDADDELWAAVARLPPKQRLAVTYRYLADLPYRTIAGLLGGTEAAARQNVRAGLRTLRLEVHP